MSGAPKVRAMQIIDDLEATRRGPYGGGVGYVGNGGCSCGCGVRCPGAGVPGDAGHAGRTSLGGIPAAIQTP